MGKILILFLFLPFNSLFGQCDCNPNESILIKNESKGRVEIRVWKNSILIHNHIMKSGDELSVQSNQNILLQVKYLDDFCRSSTEKKPKNRRFGRYLPDGWIETLIEYKEFSKIKKVRILDPECPQA